MFKIEFHIKSFPTIHKVWLKQCGGTRRFFFCFGHPSGTIFLGMPIRVCLHLSKIIFTSSVGWRDTAPPFTWPKTAKALVQKLQIWLLTNFFGFILFLQDGVSENSILWLNWSHKKVISTKFMICWHMSNYIYSIQLFDEFCDCFLNLDCNNSSLFNLQKSLLIICIIFLLLCWKRK